MHGMFKNNTDNINNNFTSNRNAYYNKNNANKVKNSHLQNKP